MTESKQVLGPDDVRRAVTRMAHEIIERNHGLDGVVLVGLQRGECGWPRQLGAEIARIERRQCRSGRSTSRFYRDDIGLRPVVAGCGERHPVRRSTARTVVLVDDVLFTGRTVRAALDAITDYGRPRRGAARRARRPRPPRAADPPRLRRQEPARRRRDEDVRVHARASSSATSSVGRRHRMKHFRSIDELGPDGLRRLLDLTDHMAEVNRRADPARFRRCAARRSCNVFFEDSTRTRLSFETAAKRLSADTMNFSVSSSSVNKGESLRDTVETIAAMGVDAFVVRHKSSGVPWQVGQWTTSERDQRRRRLARPPHPGAARLLHDPHRAQPRDGFDGLHIAIVGDIKHSRVARSDVAAFTCSAPTSRSSRRRRCCRRRSRVAGRGHHRSRRDHRRARRDLPAADAARADDRGARAEPARVHDPVRPHARARATAAASTR